MIEIKVDYKNIKSKKCKKLLGMRVITVEQNIQDWTK